MRALAAIFEDCHWANTAAASMAAGHSDSAATGQADGGADGDAEGQDSLSFDYADNPFASLMRQVEFLCDTSPQEAYRLLRQVASEGLYTAPHEMEALSSKMDEIYEQARQQESQDYLGSYNSYSPKAPVIGSAFDRGALALPSLAANDEAADEPGMAPVPGSAFAPNRLVM